MMPFQLVIFDYDGTLADSGQWFSDNINRFARRHGFREVKPEEIEMLRGMPTRQVIRHLKVRPWKLPAIARDMRRAVGEPGGTAELFEGVDALLARVQEAGIAIAVVSSNSEANVRVGLGPVAARVKAFGGGASLFGKARKLRQLARKFGVPGDQVLCVGDDSRDIDAAHKAGLKAAAVSWGYAKEEALRSASPDYLVHSIDELATVLGV